MIAVAFRQAFLNVMSLLAESVFAKRGFATPAFCYPSAKSELTTGLRAARAMEANTEREFIVHPAVRDDVTGGALLDGYGPERIGEYDALRRARIYDGLPCLRPRLLERLPTPVVQSVNDGSL